MEGIEKRIQSIAEKVIEADQKLFLVDVRVKGNVGNQKVLIFIDNDEGLSIDECSSVNRQVGKILEEEDFMPGKYFLEVSSPGLDHPIKLSRQYKKNKGRQLEVETLDGEKLTGKLLDVDETTIVLDTQDEKKKIDFEEINQSKIVVAFK